MPTKEEILSELLKLPPFHIGDPPSWLIPALGKDQLIGLAQVVLERNQAVNQAVLNANQEAYTKALKIIGGKR